MRDSNMEFQKDLIWDQRHKRQNFVLCIPQMVNSRVFIWSERTRTAKRTGHIGDMHCKCDITSAKPDCSAAITGIKAWKDPKSTDKLRLSSPKSAVPLLCLTCWIELRSCSSHLWWLQSVFKN